MRQIIKTTFIYYVGDEPVKALLGYPSEQP